jgi:hypothetical protein
MTLITDFTEIQLFLFKEFIIGAMSENMFTAMLKRTIEELNSETCVMYRFNGNTILYTYNEIVADLMYNNGNKELLLESIAAGVENNRIEILF